MGAISSRALTFEEETGSALTCVLLWGPSASQMSEIDLKAHNWGYISTCDRGFNNASPFLY